MARRIFKHFKLQAHSFIVSNFKQCSTMDKVHQSAVEGFQKGSAYDQHRPSYTDELITHAVSQLHTGGGDGVQYDILELGAGTGLCTRRMLEKIPQGLRYLASDFSEGFLTTLREQSPGVQTQVFTANNIPLPDASVKNIICAQCFHWFAKEEALTEMMRVLVPQGRVMLLYNNKLYQTVPWLGEMEDVLTLYYGNTPRKFSGHWLNVIQACQSLRLVEHKFLPGITNMKGDKQFIMDHYSTISVISRLQGSKREEALAGFQRVLDKHFPEDQEILLEMDSELYCVEKL
ncbi:YL8A-like protein [Mya arenaria]|uniref:YL8A-like protein n=1 Tax=Mya arenaria TaxID=6604 RepID=A0ABY7EF57_MYAAR|nr:uncharacterized protein LOC128239102 [Mya arenaria]XP_052811528.1 uncharacterized protein LOC128239102 [Mya arenaria]WAR07562.1 YL8A-like protein [Mya arenaria]